MLLRKDDIHVGWGGGGGWGRLLQVNGKFIGRCIIYVMVFFFFFPKLVFSLQFEYLA